MPHFGYPAYDFGEHKSMAIQSIRPNVVARTREDLFASHVLKCFTYGKSVRRTVPYDPTNQKNPRSKIEDIQRRFNRIGLLRKYYSKRREAHSKKFDFPVDQRGKLHLDEDKECDYDYMQYCAVSDLDEHEYISARRHKDDTGSTYNSSDEFASSDGDSAHSSVLSEHEKKCVY